MNGLPNRCAAGQMLNSRWMDLLLEADPSSEAILQYAARSQAVFFEERGRPAAICLFGPSEDGNCTELFNVSVHQDFRRRGLATALLGNILEDRSLRPFRVCTGSVSFDALALYQKLGFRIVGVDSDFFTRNYSEPLYENGIQLRDRIIMELH